MTGLDWVIAGVVLLLALFGWSHGFIAGLLSLAGFAAGAWLGTRIGPLVLPDGNASPVAPFFGLAGAVLAGFVLAAGFEGVGARLRRLVPIPGFAAVDGLLGAILTGCVGLAVAWLLGAIVLANGGRDLRREVQRSEILSRINAVAPPSGPLLNALARFDPFPHVDQPGARVPPPPPGIGRDPDVRATRPSVVRILGTACGLGVQGSGWVAGPGLVVTNAHVVAGQDDTVVQRGGEGDGLRARAVHYDPGNDVAVLQVDGLDAPALELAPDPPSGTPAAILGFPLDGPYDVRAGRLGTTRTVVTQDAYGAGPLQRRITSLRGTVRSGNSGGPAVDGAGRVVTTVFAAATRGPRGGFGVPNAIVAKALQDSTGPVSTGSCA
jgi:hypothetical protein